jgi:hypothetical protein
MSFLTNSKFQTGRAPRIVKALTFEPKEMQTGLSPVNIGGNPESRIDPRSGDFYRAIIELRSSIKARLKSCSSSEREALESQQQALKILANATSYGIFVEINVEELTKPANALRYSDDGTPSEISVDKAEVPGTYFHPLLASLITAAARLMLGVAERLAVDAGLDWAFCDTDSMAFAKPAHMEDAEFHRRVADIRDWFNALNPYEGAGDLLKLEDANFELVDGSASSTLAPLYVWAISAKRYALFNLDATGRSVLRKASAHGLGHLMAPYSEAATPLSIPAPVASLKIIGVDSWQYDVWYRIVEAALNGCPDRPNLSDLPGFDKPAASRYAATTPSLLRWYDPYNNRRDNRDQVRPFNFLTVFPARRNPVLDWAEFVEEPGSDKRRSRDSGDLPRPVAPYNSDPARASQNCFDRLTGEPVPADRLKSYVEALADYHLHPETKFLNGDYTDRGPTVRRHVHIAGVRYIGKEANRWEEQFYLGRDPEAQIEYDSSPEATEQAVNRISQAVAAFGQRQLASASAVAREQLRAILKGEAQPRPKTIAKLLRAISLLEAEAHEKRTPVLLVQKNGRPTVRPNGRMCDKASRWVLYHGTSTSRLNSILKEDRLRISNPGDPKISLTTERSVAEYWANLAVYGDRQDRSDRESNAVVLVLDGEKLLAGDYDLTEFRDDIWGEGECDWENEIACWDDIEPYSDFLIAVEPVKSDRGLDLTEDGHKAFKPVIPPIAGFELIVMSDTIGKLIKGEITPALADAVVSALRGLRSALDFKGN